MQYRELGRTGFKVSTISFGAWAIGADWGKTDDKESLKALHTAMDAGMNFIDTADVYGDGHSEKLIAKLRKEHTGNTIIVATKCGRRLPQQTVEGYTRENITAWIERSLKNLEVDALDLVQLHCPPTGVYYQPEVFGILDDLVKDGKIRHYGVSVEKVEEALKAIEYPNVQTVQIIFNIFRQRPTALFFQQALTRKIGILARVPLASGLLTGKITADTKFAKNDHRNFNKNGESFDVGETFSGVDFDKALQAVEELKPLVPEDATLAQLALRWILMFEAVTCAIPGAKNPEQALDNAQAADLSGFSPEKMQRISAIYNKYIRADVHQRW